MKNLSMKATNSARLLRCHLALWVLMTSIGGQTALAEAGGVHGGGGSELIGNFVKAAQEEIDQTLFHVDPGHRYQKILKETLQNLQSITLLKELSDETGRPVNLQGLHAYSWPGTIQLSVEYWAPRLVEVSAARHSRVEIIHELLRATPPTADLDTNDEGYRITIQTLHLDQNVIKRDGVDYRIWPNGGGLVDLKADVSAKVYVDIYSTITGDVEIASNSTFTSSHVKAVGGKLSIGSDVNFASGYADANGVIGSGSRIASGNLYGHVEGRDFSLSSGSVEGSLISGGSVVIYSSGIKGDFKLDGNARITSSHVEGTVTFGRYTSVQNSALEGQITVSDNSLIYDSKLNGIISISDTSYLYNSILHKHVSVGGTSFLYDTTLDAGDDTISISNEVRLNNVQATGKIDIKYGVSIFQSNLVGPVAVKEEVAICRQQIKAANIEKSMCK